MSVNEQKRLSKLENEIYSWQSDVEGFGPDGQEKLKNATVLISRCGGLGGVVAYELAAAGIGKMILAHAGNIKPSDLNRQLLMTREGIGQSRMDSIQCRLKELNPDLEIQACPENISVENADALVQHADVVVDGEVNDTARIAYIEAHLEAAKRAISDGAPLIGYYIWSLMDNYEWALGYEKRFGLVHVDFDSLKRTPKNSYKILQSWLAD